MLLGLPASGCNKPTNLQRVADKQHQQRNGHLERWVLVEHEGCDRNEQLPPQDDNDPEPVVGSEVVVHPANEKPARWRKPHSPHGSHQHTRSIHVDAAFITPQHDPMDSQHPGPMSPDTKNNHQL